MRKRPRSHDWKTSDERIVSASVTKEKRKRKQVSAYPGAQQPQVHGNGEIVTGSVMNEMGRKTWQGCGRQGP